MFFIVINVKEPRLLDATSWFFIFSAFTMASGSFFALIKIVLIRIFSGQSLQIFHFKDAFRQGILLGVLLSVMLFLQKEGNLNLITGAVALFLIILIEFILSRKTN